MKSKLVTTLMIAAAAFVLTSDRATAAERADSRPPTGVIVEIDRVSHSIVVAERPGGVAHRIAIPKGSRVSILPTIAFGSSVDFERLMIGLQYRGINVK